MLKKEYKKTYGYDKLINDKEDITVAFIGGSLTQGGNYTTPFIEAWSNHREGKITVINAGIGGTGSNFGAMRLKDENGNIEASGSCKSYTSPSYWYENILLTAFGLPDGKHTLEITVSEDKQADKEGYMFGIGEIWVDEE